MPLSQNLIKVYASAPVDLFYVEALSITHSALKSPINITNWLASFSGQTESASETFVPMPFSVKLPSKDTNGSQKLDITISNANQSIIQEIEWMSTMPYESAVCRYRVYLSNDFTVQQINPAMTFDITSFTVSRNYVTCTASKVNTHNQAFPKLLYNIQNFPGLK